MFMKPTYFHEHGPWISSNFAAHCTIHYRHQSIVVNSQWNCQKLYYKKKFRISLYNVVLKLKKETCAWCFYKKITLKTNKNRIRSRIREKAWFIANMFVALTRTKWKLDYNTPKTLKKKEDTFRTFFKSESFRRPMQHTFSDCRQFRIRAGDKHSWQRVFLVEYIV